MAGMLKCGDCPGALSVVLCVVLWCMRQDSVVDWVICATADVHNVCIVFGIDVHMKVFQ